MEERHKEGRGRRRKKEDLEGSSVDSEEVVAVGVIDIPCLAPDQPCLTTVDRLRLRLRYDKIYAILTKSKIIDQDPRDPNRHRRNKRSAPIKSINNIII